MYEGSKSNTFKRLAFPGLSSGKQSTHVCSERFQIPFATTRENTAYPFRRYMGIYAWLTLGGEQRLFQPLNHKKQKWEKCFPTTTTYVSRELGDPTLPGGFSRLKPFQPASQVSPPDAQPPGNPLSQRKVGRQLTKST